MYAVPYVPCCVAAYSMGNGALIDTRHSNSLSWLNEQRAQALVQVLAAAEYTSATKALRASLIWQLVDLLTWLANGFYLQQTQYNCFCQAVQSDHQSNVAVSAPTPSNKTLPTV